MIYKILREQEYTDMIIDGQTKGASIDLQDGYIHFSTKDQLSETLSRHFEDETELFLLAVDENTLADIKWEKSRGGDLFPHLYNILSMSDVVETYELHGHELPQGLK